MSGYIGNIPTPQATQSRQSFTATSGQTSFATVGYTPGFVDVYVNGVHMLDGSDYNATNGSDVVLTTGATAGDIVEVISYATFEVNSQTFTGTTTVDNLNVTGTFTSRGIDDNADATAITIDSSENVFVGRTSDSFGTVGSSYRANGSISATASANEVLDLNRLSTDGGIMRFFKDGTTVGSIGSHAGFITMGSGDTSLIFDSTANTIEPFNQNDRTSEDAAVTLGWSTNRFKDLYLSGGVYLGGTGAANYLDDYEEGTWTPAWGDSAGNSYTGSYVTSGRYTKVGNVIVASWEARAVNDVTVYGLVGTNGILLTGLPFANNSNHFMGGTINNYNIGTAVGTFLPFIARSGSSISFRTFQAAVEGTMSVNEFNGGSRLIYGQVIYRTN